MSACHLDVPLSMKNSDWKMARKSTEVFIVFITDMHVSRCSIIHDYPLYIIMLAVCVADVVTVTTQFVSIRSICSGVCVFD